MPIPLRADYDAARLRLAARESRDAGQTRRLLALAVIYDGATRLEAASIGGITMQVVRDWLVKLKTGGRGGPRGRCSCPCCRMRRYDPRCGTCSRTAATR